MAAVAPTAAAQEDTKTAIAGDPEAGYGYVGVWALDIWLLYRFFSHPLPSQVAERSAEEIPQRSAGAREVVRAGP